MARRLIIDESLNKRLASTLKRRGRDAISVPELGCKGLRDPDLLRTLATSHPRCVLVTADDRMPEEHADLLRELGTTLATIDPNRPPELTEEQWQWDVVERWAHKMGEQELGTWRRYGRRVREWRPRTRPRRIAPRIDRKR